MQISYKYESAHELVIKQLNNIFFLSQEDQDVIFTLQNKVEQSIYKCFSPNLSKYYTSDEGFQFDIYNGQHYAVYLYFLSHFAYLDYANVALASKLFSLNRTLHGCDLFYEVNLPEIFYLIHPYGTGLGRASYSNYFVAMQHCTVGQNQGVYPTFGEYVWMFSHSVILGASKVGNNVFISSGSYIKDQEIPDNTIVFGTSPDLKIVQKPAEYFYSKSPFKSHIEHL